jgi:cell division protein ZapA
MEELSITIMIADRSYKLLIEKEQEETVRNAAKMIDKRIREYSGSYAYKDKQDLLAMAALEFTTSLLQKERSVKEKEDDSDHKLAEIDKALDEALQQIR